MADSRIREQVYLYRPIRWREKDDVIERGVISSATEIILVIEINISDIFDVKW